MTKYNYYCIGWTAGIVYPGQSYIFKIERKKKCRVYGCKQAITIRETVVFKSQSLAEKAILKIDAKDGQRFIEGMKYESNSGKNLPLYDEGVHGRILIFPKSIEQSEIIDAERQ